MDIKKLIGEETKTKTKHYFFIHINRETLFNTVHITGLYFWSFDFSSLLFSLLKTNILYIHEYELTQALGLYLSVIKVMYNEMNELWLAFAKSLHLYSFGIGPGKEEGKIHIFF